MLTAVNHLAFAAKDPAAIAADYETLLDRKADRYEAEDGTPFYRFQLTNIAFEISPLMGREEGLSGIGYEAADIDATARKFGRRGLGMGSITDRIYRGIAGTADMTRRAAGIDPVTTHGVPFTIVETTSPSRGDQTVTSSVSGLDHVVIRSPNPERAIALYGGRFGLDFALDRSNPDWGSRLLFFMCGGVRVEIGHSLAKGVSDLPDSLWGVAWRVTDTKETEMRLQRAGLNTSDAKAGRRPGSHVMTVRSGTGNVPTIMLSAVPKDAA